MKSRVLAGDAAMAELRHRLRHVHLDDLLRRPERWRGIGHGSEIGMGGKRAENMVERLAELLGIDVADHRDHELVAGEDALHV